MQLNFCVGFSFLRVIVSDNKKKKCLGVFVYDKRSIKKNKKVFEKSKKINWLSENSNGFR